MATHRYGEPSEVEINALMKILRDDKSDRSRPDEARRRALEILRQPPDRQKAAPTSNGNTLLLQAILRLPLLPARSGPSGSGGR